MNAASNNIPHNFKNYNNGAITMPTPIKNNILGNKFVVENKSNFITPSSRPGSKSKTSKN